ncbi:hypothetical protein HAX54_022762 [Datura stramonium]|uniref:Uncharacterized protein n=1 Tax=Datura stramonium TaxID=4076 RepID=A0ABS8S6W8_DATST|nr:hypothetical protein [Datura stramonium]
MWRCVNAYQEIHHYGVQHKKISHSFSSPKGKFHAREIEGNLIFRSKWAELNGATGDLGTYIPIVLALTLASDLNLGTTLIFTGVYNFVTGAIYGVPMPVQPMKSIAAVAISNPQLTYRKLWLPEFAPPGSCSYWDFMKSKSGGERDWLGLDGLLLALICAVLLCCLAIIRGPNAVKGFKFGPSRIEVCVGAVQQDLFPERGNYSYLGVRIGRLNGEGFDVIPVGVLGVLLLFAGIELAMCSRDMNTKEESFVVLVCTAVSMVGSSAALGVLLWDCGSFAA